MQDFFSCFLKIHLKCKIWRWENIMIYLPPYEKRIYRGAFTNEKIFVSFTIPSDPLLPSNLGSTLTAI